MKSHLCFCLVLPVLAAMAHAQERLPSEQACLSILRSDAGLEQKARACQQLSIVGTRQSVATLAGLLDDERLSDYARFALEQIDDPSVDAALREALAKVRDARLAGVISSIGARHDAQAVRGLKKLVDDGSSASVQAIAALGQIATDEAIQVIVPLLDSGSEDMRIAAAEACLAAGQRLMMEGQAPAAMALFGRIAEARVPGHVRSAATYNRILAGGEGGVPLLVEQLQSGDPGRVEIALLAARKLPGRKVSSALAAELPGLDPVVQVLVIKALLDREDPSVLGVIERLAESENADVRREALRALGRMGEASSVAILLKAAGTPGPDSQIALAGLRTIHTEDIEQRMVAGMTAAEGPRKADLIDIIAARQFKTACPFLLAEASSANESVATASLKALADLAGPHDLPALLELLAGARNSRVRNQAETTVAAVAVKGPDPSAQSGDVVERLQSADGETRLALLRVLGRIGDERALAALRDALDSNSQAVRDTAIRALAACPNPRARDTLLDICDTAGNDTHRILALRGYVRLLDLDDRISPRKKAALYAQAMSRATAAGEKKQVLAALARVSHPEALTVVTDCLDDAAVRQEAILAALSIAQRTAGAAPDQARLMALKISELTPSPQIKAQAQSLVQAIDGFGDFIVSWMVTGFYTEAHRDHNTLLWMTFEPEVPGNKAAWSLMPAGTDPQRPWILDLLSLYPGDNRVAYAKTWVYSEKPQEGLLELGTDDGVKVWLNDQLVHTHSIARAAVPGSDRVEVSLKQGWNALMLKISQNNAQWEFCARIRDAEGITIDCFHDEPSDPKQAAVLFDGATFTGWEGNLRVFRIEEGGIVGGTLKNRIERNEFLCTETEYSDFELRLKVKLLGENANAGIQIRSRRVPNHHEMIGYQADMGQHYWGCLYDESRRNRVLAGPDPAAMQKALRVGDWNDYVIRCEGKRIRLWINGFQTVDYTETDDTIEQTGIIGLQIHGGGPSEAWYKDMVIRPL